MSEKITTSSDVLIDYQPTPVQEVEVHVVPELIDSQDVPNGYTIEAEESHENEPRSRTMGERAIQLTADQVALLDQSRVPGTDAYVEKQEHLTAVARQYASNFHLQ